MTFAFCKNLCLFVETQEQVDASILSLFIQLFRKRQRNWIVLLLNFLFGSTLFFFRHEERKAKAKAKTIPPFSLHSTFQEALKELDCLTFEFFVWFDPFLFQT
jgi:hypothetical protein